jgi:hypothetical protein
MLTMARKINSMDVHRFILELRAEREDIEHAILSLEKGDQLRNGTTSVAKQSVTDIRRVKEPGGGRS